MEVIDFITLAVLGGIDYVSYKIPNVILLAWLWTIFYLPSYCGFGSDRLGIEAIVVSLLVTGSFIPFRHIVRCNAGDFKLYGVLTLSRGLKESTWILFITCIISLIPLASGCKKVPMAFITLFGYIAFILFIKDVVI